MLVATKDVKSQIKGMIDASNADGLLVVHRIALNLVQAVWGYHTSPKFRDVFQVSCGKIPNVPLRLSNPRLKSVSKTHATFIVPVQYYSEKSETMPPKEKPNGFFLVYNPPQPVVKNVDDYKIKIPLSFFADVMNEFERPVLNDDLPVDYRLPPLGGPLMTMVQSISRKNIKPCKIFLNPTDDGRFELTAEEYPDDVICDHEKQQNFRLAGEIWDISVTKAFAEFVKQFSKASPLA